MADAFTRVYASFLEGRASFDELRLALAKSLENESASRGDISEIIESGFRDGHLPYQVYFSLKDSLETIANRTVIGAGQSASDTTSSNSARSPAGATRVGKPTRVDPARIADRPPQEDATRIRNGPPGTRSVTAPPTTPPPPRTGAPPAPHTAPPTNAAGSPSGVQPSRPASVPPGTPTTGVAEPDTGRSVSRTGATDIRWSDPNSWPEEANHSLGVGTVLKDRFVLEEELGRGGMGRVYKAIDRRKEEARDREPHVAIKILGDEFKQHPDSFVALQREARRAQSLSHPNVVNVYDFDRDGPHVFMTMEFLEGRPLDRIIREVPRKGMPYNEAWPIIKGIGDALAYGHKKRIVHSDFKPGNVFLCADGTPKVLDFGISRPVSVPDDPGATMTRFDPGEVFGGLTEAYAALEMFQRQNPDPRDDIYALACVCYELLTGRHPFGKASALEAESKNLKPRRIRRLTPNQWQGIERGLAFRRADRIASVDEFLRAVGPGGDAPTRLSRLWITGIVAASALTVALLVATVIRVSDDALPTSVATTPVGPPPELSEDTIRIHEELREEARMTIADARATADSGTLVFILSRSPNSAMSMLGTVLEENPFDEDARQLVVDVGNVYADNAESLLERGQIASSLELVRYGLDADTTSVRLANLERKICRQAPDQCGP